jgi:hypothetical protein
MAAKIGFCCNNVIAGMLPGKTGAIDGPEKLARFGKLDRTK